MAFNNYSPDDAKPRSSLPKVNRDRWNPRTPTNTSQQAISHPKPNTDNDDLTACQFEVLRLEVELLARGVKPIGQNGPAMTFEEGYKIGLSVGREEGIKIGRKEGAEEEAERWASDLSSSQSDEKLVENGEEGVSIEIWKIKLLVLVFCAVVWSTYVACL